MKLFTGTANTQLSQEVSDLLNIPLAKAEIVRFGNSEVKVTIQEDVRDQVCVIIQPTSNPTDTNIMELLLFTDALERCEAKQIIAVIPYFGYARQNAQHREGECVSMNMVIKILETVGVDEVITFTIHEEASTGMFTVPFENIDALSAIAHKMKTESYPDENIAVVTPDQEGVERARKFGDILMGDKPYEMVVTEKRRNLNEIHKSEALNLFGDVKDKTCIIADDIATSGGTLINSAQLCLDRGAKRIVAVIAHPDFNTDTPQKIQNSQIEKFYTTNTIALKDSQLFPKLEVVSVASQIAEKLKNYL